MKEGRLRLSLQIFCDYHPYDVKKKLYGRLEAWSMFIIVIFTIFKSEKGLIKKSPINLKLWS
ncbi:hypothetical protein D3C74_170200 [compost metagenome]